MSVIAKMNVCAVPRAFSECQLVELSCVCASELMPGCGDGSAKANENHTFQQATPTGDAKITMAADVKFRTREELYLIFHRCADVPEFAGALAVVDARCSSITDYGGTSKRIELTNNRNYNYETRREDPRHPLAVSQFNMQMSVDNPAASIQFEAGKSGYWIGIYRASEFTMDQALRAARAPIKFVALPKECTDE